MTRPVLLLTVDNYEQLQRIARKIVGGQKFKTSSIAMALQTSSKKDVQQNITMQRRKRHRTMHKIQSAEGTSCMHNLQRAGAQISDGSPRHRQEKEALPVLKQIANLPQPAAKCLP